VPPHEGNPLQHQITEVAEEYERKIDSELEVKHECLDFDIVAPGSHCPETSGP